MIRWQPLAASGSRPNPTKRKGPYRGLVGAGADLNPRPPRDDDLVGVEEPRAVKPRLTSRDRWIVAGITVLALAAAGSAFISALSATLKFFGEQPTARESAVGGQSGWVLLWALATPFCCWAVLRGGKKAAPGLVVWLVLLMLCRIWWWPGPPSDDIEKQAQPLWQNQYGVAPWLLLVASIAIGILAVRRNPDPTARLRGVFVAAAIVIFAALSFVNITRHAQAEEPTPLAEGTTELEALRNDPLWDALPTGSITRTDEHAAVLSDWGEKFPTWRKVTLGTSLDQALFERAVSAAEASGWTLHDSFCTDTGSDGTFTKTLPPGPAYLDISMATYLSGVDVFMNLTPAPGPPAQAPQRCWER